MKQTSAHVQGLASSYLLLESLYIHGHVTMIMKHRSLVPTTLRTNYVGDDITRSSMGGIGWSDTVSIGTVLGKEGVMHAYLTLEPHSHTPTPLR